MERKVLSFDQFVFESYTTLNEEFNIKSLQNRLEGGELVNKGLSLVDELFSKSAGGIDDYSACMDAIEGFVDYLDKNSNKYSWDVTMTTNELILPGIINGMVDISAIKPREAFKTHYGEGDKLPEPTFNADAEPSTLTSVLADLNYYNLNAASSAGAGSFNKKPSLDGDKFKWRKDNYKNVEYSGLSNQIALIPKRGAIQLERINNLKGDILPPDFRTEGLEGYKATEWTKKLKKATYSFLLYGIKNIEIGEGNPMTGTKLVREVIEIGGEEEKELDIMNDKDVLFDVNKAVLKQAGKDAISAALGVFTKITSIKVTGGASQEGSEDRNKELCKLRAEAVSEYLKKITKANIEVNPEGKIQPKDDPESKRPEWRRIILEVKGETISKTVKEKIVYNTSSEDLRADKYTIAQMVLSFNVTLR